MQVANDQSFPRIQQISFFLPNKVGTLQQVIQHLERDGVRICAVSILDSHDHAVVRMVVDRPAKAIEVLQREGRTATTSDLAAVAVSAADDHGIAHVLDALLRLEINVYYTYALMKQHHGAPVLALHCDDIECATQALRRAGFDLVDQRDLESN